ncbi:MAG: alpha-mannosidase [Clostridiales bacterium]|nr:alpha-mannosidase [Clostridiales bacterium]
MQNQYRKVKKYLSILNESRWSNERDVEGITICPCEYKTNNTPPALSEFAPYKVGELWGNGWESHAWFHFTVEIPEDMKSKPVQLVIHTDKSGWDACNPQFIAYINGKLRQGLDTNHTFVVLDSADSYDCYIYGYTGPKISETRFYAKLRNLNYETEQLYYDIRVPYEMLDYIDTNSQEYAETLRHLDNAVSLLDLFEVGSDEFFESVKTAKAYMDDEFYGKYCNKNRGDNSPTTVGIGHTHIDCAWQWTLKQTREKVQRSFSTVLELMDRYPEYKFMSSQALLYQNLKEEAPEVYEQVKERIKDGRWECEGGMWVEADCNLTSGESLVRQVLYGKRFFKEEFGVDNRVLWLPDVFGYSAALPQILKKSGIDWFVTSKISWNETNKMPYDTFAWAGIDGTKINTYFLTAQDQTRGEPARYTTYVGNTGPKMVAGTWKRYQQKNLNNEALLTFGFGDGGGGPTAEMLELARRTEKGIPGAPLMKIDFAGDFLSRLEKKIENNRLLPEWRGELYLEFHRGTYTSISKNKRNNRQSEFLYLDAELIASMNKALTGASFPKAELHKGWEMILTNQFHDIIPGSSIKEVYDQCDIDYKFIKDTGNSVIDAAKTNLASKLDAGKGYVVFNPHSFNGNGVVKVDGVSAIVSNVPSKGYALTNDFVTGNSISIDGSTVETNRFTVRFDETWQIVSIFDKVNVREVITDGKPANEIRIYADHPDVYDAWEWQPYSLDDYKPLTAFESAEVVEDGVRRGIRIVRPHMKSKITQTIWFYDDIAKIDFETTADWHQQHQMVKAAFPVDINSDKATYEIQFGTIERPTHKNTSWDKAKFEVCAQKYADISEGGYGVSIINDCKYGHDIHDGVIQLSLFKSPTFPDPEADQGEISFTYSICPHAGTLADSDTVKLAYYLNYPMTAVKATGSESVIPESFSAVTLDRDNVICETIKESEDGNDTIIRLYESKNIRGKVNLTVGYDFKKAYLCDMMENPIKELDIVGNTISTDISGFEILTIKLV